MSDGAQVDYAALAKQAGAISSQPAQIDYAALAKQAGAISSQPASQLGPTPGASGVTGLRAPEAWQEKWPHLAQASDFINSFFTGAGKSVLQPVTATAKLLNAVPGIGETLAPQSGITALETGGQPQGTPEKIGAGVEQMGEMMAAEGVIKNLVTKVPGLARYAPAVRVLSAGTSAGVPSAIRGENPADPTAIGLGTAGLGEGLAATGPSLEASAAKNYQSVLAPTTNAAKNVTNQIMPRLLKESPFALTREGLAEKAGQQAENFGAQVGEAVSGLQGTMKTQPVVDSLNALKAQFRVGNVTLRPEADAAIDAVSGTIQQLGPEISSQDAVQAKRILDQAVAEANGYQGANLSDASLVNMRRAAANSFRNELNQANPDLAALNSKFHFWNSLSDVLQQAIERKTGQSGMGLLGTIATAASGVAGTSLGGFATGSTMEGAAAGVVSAAAMAAINKAVRSGAWDLVNAKAKTSIAGAMANGQFQNVINLLGKAGATGATRFKTNSAPGEPFDDEAMDLYDQAHRKL